ncbi:MAG: Secretion system C-terminal sorting domain, partial [Bacteroidota bacterium]
MMKKTIIFLLLFWAADVMAQYLPQPEQYPIIKYTNSPSQSYIRYWFNTSYVSFDIRSEINPITCNIDTLWVYGQEPLGDFIIRMRLDEFDTRNRPRKRVTVFQRLGSTPPTTDSLVYTYQGFNVKPSIIKGYTSDGTHWSTDSMFYDNQNRVMRQVIINILQQTMSIYEYNTFNRTTKITIIQPRLKEVLAYTYSNDTIMVSSSFTSYDANNVLIRSFATMSLNSSSNTLIDRTVYGQRELINFNNQRQWLKTTVFDTIGNVERIDSLISMTSNSLVMKRTFLQTGSRQMRYVTLDNTGFVIRDSISNLSNPIDYSLTRWTLGPPQCANGVVRGGGTGAPEVALNVFPNPSVDHVQFQWEDAPTPPTQLNIYNISGNLMLSRAIQPQDVSVQLETSPLPSGIYVYKILFGDTIKVGRIVIQH